MSNLNFIIMSKGNLFLGKARGKVGSVVFSTLKGQQIARSYNANPNNPRSVNQMAQRILMGAPVLFYRHATSNRLKFAFENKAQNQSDYNAFVSSNIDTQKIAMTKEMVANNFPAIGNWRLTKGSMLGINFVHTLTEGTAGKVGKSIAWAKINPNTELRTFIEDSAEITDVPNDLVMEFFSQNYNYQEGDLLTFLSVSVPAWVESGDVSYNGDVPAWLIRQYVLTGDTNVDSYFKAQGEVSLQNAGGLASGLYFVTGSFGGSEGAFLIVVTDLSSRWNAYGPGMVSSGFAFIASSKHNGTIKVSSSRLNLSDAGIEVVELLTSDAMRQRAINSYAVSQSNLASNYMLDPSKGVEGGEV